MSANEIANRLIAAAVVQTQGATAADYHIASSFGVGSLVRLAVGSYNLILLQPLDYYVNVAPSLRITRARTVPLGMTLAGATNPCNIGAVPLDVAPGGPFVPGSIALSFTNAAGVLQDLGAAFIQVWQFPTIE